MLLVRVDSRARHCQPICLPSIQGRVDGFCSCSFGMSKTQCICCYSNSMGNTSLGTFNEYGQTKALNSSKKVSKNVFDNRQCRFHLLRLWTSAPTRLCPFLRSKLKCVHSSLQTRSDSPLTGSVGGIVGIVLTAQAFAQAIIAHEP
jgi:hypothetical protein